MEQKAYTLQDRARGFGTFLYGHKAIAAIALLYLIMLFYSFGNTTSFFSSSYRTST